MLGTALGAARRRAERALRGVRGAVQELGKLFDSNGIGIVEGPAEIPPSMTAVSVGAAGDAPLLRHALAIVRLTPTLTNSSESKRHSMASYY